MARRTLSEIYDSLDQERRSLTTLNTLQPSIDDAQTLLNDINSSSKVAEWRLWQFVHAVGIWVLEGLWELFKSEVDEKIANAHYGTARWFQKVAKDFQLGFSLTWTGDRLIYTDTTSNTAVAARIVKYAAAVESGGLVTLKAAKDVGGVITKLTSGELTAFEAYIADIEPAGCNRVCVSKDPDELWLEVRVYYNPELVHMDGSSVADPSVFPIYDAVNGYLKNVNFNGKIRLSEIHDAIIATGAYSQVTFLIAKYRYGSIPWTNIVDEYTPDAGYAIVSTSPGLSHISIPDVQN
jgi:hypothetical protein